MDNINCNSLNQYLLPLIFVIAFSLVSAPVSALIEIKDEVEVIAPLNWEPIKTDNSTSMMWSQNSTKSVFAIIKAPNNLAAPLILAGPFLTGYLKYKGILESADQLTFGHNNHGYRYFLNLSSPSSLLNSTSGIIQENNFLREIPHGYDIPYKGMLILTEKHSKLYAIIFLSPNDKFNSILNEINPALDSIQLTKYTEMEN